MTELQRCRYSLIKYTHDPVRFEPVNVGVLIWRLTDPGSVRWQFDTDLKRVSRLYPSSNTRLIGRALTVFRDRVLAQPELLNEGLPGDQTIVASEPRAVRCTDLDLELSDLYEMLVEPAEVDADEPRERHRSSQFVKSRMAAYFKKMGVLQKLVNQEQAQKLRAVECKSGVKVNFDFAYVNSTIHRIEAISFDHGNNQERINRARYAANLFQDALGGPTVAQADVLEAVVQVPMDPLASAAYEDALKILSTTEVRIVEVNDDGDIERFCELTRSQLAHTQ